ncbi:nuclease-related domain-containing protein [Thalassotalea litorea]|uniref:nuclease-related domain-containing protein n=1 Tax=Thalassotalea litorea TaxID=2020715 RepID=UPI0037364862
MILKDKSLQNAVSPTAKAGQKQEQDVAFFLRRAFKDHNKVFVINDFKFTHNNETAQIDHLIIYTFGFVLIESKSIKGEVKVNKLGEWTRSLGNKWSGIPSPIKQVELQQKLLREMLHANREAVLGKLLGIKQQSFGLRCWDNICAVSSDAIIDRDSMPNKVSKQLVKTEFLVEKLEKIMNLKHKVVSTLTFDSRPDFSDKEMQSIATFLLNQKHSQILPKNPEENEVQRPWQPPKNNSALCCKSCDEKSDFSPQSGRYGYYIKCNKCGANTAMKTPCNSCGSKNTKVSKRKDTYTLSCGDCSDATVLLG